MLGDCRERQQVQAFLGLARQVHENHAHNKAGVAIPVAGDHNTVTMDFFTRSAD